MPVSADRVFAEVTGMPGLVIECPASPTTTSLASGCRGSSGSPAMARTRAWRPRRASTKRSPSHAAAAGWRSRGRILPTATSTSGSGDRRGRREPAHVGSGRRPPPHDVPRRARTGVGGTWQRDAQPDATSRGRVSAGPVRPALGQGRRPGRAKKSGGGASQPRSQAADLEPAPDPQVPDPQHDCGRPQGQPDDRRIAEEQEGHPVVAKHRGQRQQ